LLLVIHLLLLKHGNTKRVSLAWHFGTPRRVTGFLGKQFRFEHSVQSDNALPNSQNIIRQVRAGINDDARVGQAVVKVTATFELSLQSRDGKLDAHENCFKT
jgi:hypothetical protein